MRGVFVGLTTLDVAQLVESTVKENQKVPSLEQLICAGGPATNAAVTFAALDAAQMRLGGAEYKTASPLLVSALGLGTCSEIIRADLDEQSVEVVDCTNLIAVEPEKLTPAVSTIFVNSENGTRTLASTNSRLPLDEEKAISGVTKCDDEVCVLLVDGHNYQLAQAVLPLKLNDNVRVADSASGKDLLADDPFREIETKPNYLRILDGGSWKPWLPTILPYVDVAVISADFKAPLTKDIAGTVEFLKGFGITKVVQTNGEKPVHYWWDGETGEVPVPEVETVCTLGAGDVFHGAFAWGCAQLWNHSNELNLTQAVEIIKFAVAIGAQSVQSFGTRTWLKELALQQ